MYLENIAEIIKLSTVIIMVAILIFGAHVTYLAIEIRNEIMKKLNEIDTKIDKLRKQYEI